MDKGKITNENNREGEISKGKANRGEWKEMREVDEKYGEKWKGMVKRTEGGEEK